MANPAAVRSHLLRMHRAVRDGAGDNAQELSLDRLQERLMGEAHKQLQQPGVKGVRFRVVQGEGGTRIRGEVLEEPDG